MTQEEARRRKPRRTHKELTDSLFNGLSDLISTQKFGEIGINDLAEHSSVEKNFIYTHYGEIGKFYAEYVKKNEQWGRHLLSSDTYNELSSKNLFSIVLKDLYHSFSENRDFQNIIRWEVATPNEAVIENARKREEETTGFAKNAETYHNNHPEKDLPCLIALLNAGIYYLLLHKDVSTSVGIDFSEPGQSKRILDVIDHLAEIYFKEDK